MTQKQFEKANKIKDEITTLKNRFYEARHIETCHKGYGICRQYWDDILNLLWKEEEYREQIDKALFNALADYKEDLNSKIKSLENEFNQL
jgi:uncharacterized protein YdcH (DUF465 family)